MLRSSIITILCGGGWITDAPVTGVAPSWGLFVWTAKLDGSVIEAQIAWLFERGTVTWIGPFNHPCFPTDVRFGERYGLPRLGGIPLKELRMWTRVLIQPYTVRRGLLSQVSLLSLLRRNYPIQQTHSHLNQEIPFLPKLLVPKPHFSKPHPLLSNKQVSQLPYLISEARVHK
jgi:hypothetical protein